MSSLYPSAYRQSNSPVSGLASARLNGVKSAVQTFGANPAHANDGFSRQASGSATAAAATNPFQRTASVNFGAIPPINAQSMEQVGQTVAQNWKAFMALPHTKMGLALAARLGPALALFPIASGGVFSLMTGLATLVGGFAAIRSGKWAVTLLKEIDPQMLGKAGQSLLKMVNSDFKEILNDPKQFGKFVFHLNTMTKQMIHHMPALPQWVPSLIQKIPLSLEHFEWMPKVKLFNWQPFEGAYQWLKGLDSAKTAIASAKDTTEMSKKLYHWGHKLFIRQHPNKGPLSWVQQMVGHRMYGVMSLLDAPNCKNYGEFLSKMVANFKEDFKHTAKYDGPAALLKLVGGAIPILGLPLVFAGNLLERFSWLWGGSKKRT